MKKYSIYIVAMLLLLISACSPEEFGDPVTHYNVKANLVGTWQITQAIQVDENAQFRGFPDAVTYRDITNALPGHSYTDFKITFKQDGTYTVDKGNSLVEVPDTQGTWTLSSPEQASGVMLKGANGNELRLDLFDISGLHYANPASRSLQLGIIRYLGKRPFVSYRYRMAYQQ